MARRVIRRMAVLFIALFAIGIPTAHAQYDPTQPGFIIDPPTVGQAGGPVAVNGKGCPPSSTVNIYLDALDGTLLGTTTARPDADGGFTTTVTIPAGLSVGAHTVFVRCGQVVMSNSLTVTAPTPITAATRLPVTGSDSMAFVRIALVLVALGGLLVLSTRRRRQQQRV